LFITVLTAAGDLSGFKMFIREAFDSDLDAVMAVESAAFGSDEEAGLVADLLADPSAMPYASLLAFDGDRAVGHILFTKANLMPSYPITISILAPLAVIPGEQKKGIGGALIEHGLKMLSESGVYLVFVLGHPSYYPRFGFWVLIGPTSFRKRPPKRGWLRRYARE